ncbi:hypothetical protein CONPUDRAFT_136496 [Coniophora puteana RWD-64-598 SS2]|uniref:F-box domain-containing protein n=1 Tax=Coniophora puteana (strain RWD-64-598) TaxID=741705 RepID=A0A5M3MXT8_CONPW|nr:uncharacterized protein CONPUDRAFT_136496 [Coniophora puteana RWD-64-598 SS2]EIW83545.1 hypothetical protein CONPUDRAFT_136496 [Coniophora puteana RWD-64-598 SS2]
MSHLVNSSIMGTEQEVLVVGIGDLDDGHRSVSFNQSASAMTFQMMLESANLMSLPIEIAWAVLSQLHPADLVRLCRTAKAFRDMLISDSSESIKIWKAAREVHGDIPAPMPGVSEFRWATWLFENPPCEVCNHRISQWHLDVYLSIGHRVYEKCFWKKCKNLHIRSRKRNNHLSRREARDLIPAFPVPPTEYASDWEGFTRGGLEKPHRMYYWHADINEVLDTLRALEGDITLNKPGAQQALSEYKDHRKELVRLYVQGYMDFECWREQEAPRVRAKNCERLQNYIATLGHSWSDFMLVQYHHPRPFHNHLFSRDTELRYEEWIKEEPLVFE